LIFQNREKKGDFLDGHICSDARDIRDELFVLYDLESRYGMSESRLEISLEAVKAVKEDACDKKRVVPPIAGFRVDGNQFSNGFIVVQEGKSSFLMRVRCDALFMGEGSM
jgi:hypothetical protein